VTIKISSPSKVQIIAMCWGKLHPRHCFMREFTVLLEKSHTVSTIENLGYDHGLVWELKSEISWSRCFLPYSHYQGSYITRLLLVWVLLGLLTIYHKYIYKGIYLMHYYTHIYWYLESIHTVTCQKWVYIKRRV
jgi:hypothetical protein